MKRWARALPLILVGVGAVMATRTATEPATTSGAAAAVMARAAVAHPAARSRPAPRPGTDTSLKGPAVRSAATARPAAEDAAVSGEAAAPAVTVPAVKGSAPARPEKTPPAVKSPAAARPAASGAPASVLQVTTAGDASPPGTPRIAVEVDPGTSVRRSFVVVNRSADLVLTVHLASVDASASPSGAVHYASTSSPGSPATWLTLSDVVASLEPGGKLPVSLTLTPPANAAPGAVIAAVVAQVEHAARASDQAAVPEHASVTVPVAIKVMGAATALVSIEGADVINVHGHTFLEITFQNGGATSNTMVGRVEVRGSTSHTIPVRASVAPLTRTVVRVPFAMPTGAKMVPISVVASDAGGDEASWSGTAGFAAKPAPSGGSHASGRHSTVHRLTKTLTAHGATLPRLALVLVVLAFLAAALWFVSELRKSRAPRRAIKRAAAGPSAAMVPVGPSAPVGTSGVGPSAVVPGAAVVEVAAGRLGAAADDPMGAVAAQLGALVEAIDRLAQRLGDAPARPPIPAPVPLAVAVSARPASSDEPPVPVPPAASIGAAMAESGALLYAPASAVPEPVADDLYDWPTEAQLEQFTARRRAAETSPD